MTKATYEPLSNAPYVMFTVEDTGKQYKSTTDVTTSTTTTVNGVETTTTTVVAEGGDLVLTRTRRPGSTRCRFQGATAFSTCPTRSAACTSRTAR